MYYQALVNKKHRYQEKMFVDRELIVAKDIDEENIEIEKKTYEAYVSLKDFVYEEKGYELGLDSAYRSLSYQQEIYERFVSDYGEEYARGVVAPVGASEHHTGLAIDFSIKNNGKFTTDNYELMKDVIRYQEIVPYLSLFGFILRYPKGREEITGYPYEPWHIRYVGVELATKLYQENLTLEEYYQSLSGVLVVNKEKGMTSRDVVNLVSQYFYTKKVGHTGTLDPLAEGVLVVPIGKATRISEYLTATYKEYIATFQLGLLTDTLDSTGKVLEKSDVLDDVDMNTVLKSFQKTYLQEVPIYSAVKVGGKKLYEYAREGKMIVLPKKEVTIKEIELIDEENGTFTFRCVVSKGCYIRSLIRDIGESLGTYATMLSLKRIKQGEFSIQQANSLNDIRNGNISIFSIKDALSIYLQISVDEALEKKVRNGVKLENIYEAEGICILLNSKGETLAIYQAENEILIPLKVLYSAND